MEEGDSSRGFASYFGTTFTCDRGYLKRSYIVGNQKTNSFILFFFQQSEKVSRSHIKLINMRHG